MPSLLLGGNYSIWKSVLQDMSVQEKEDKFKDFTLYILMRHIHAIVATSIPEAPYITVVRASFLKQVFMQALIGNIILFMT